MAQSAIPEVDYPHLPGTPDNPLMESPLHARWVATLLVTIRNTLGATDALVTGNTPFVPEAEGVHTAPDLMVIPGARDKVFRRYVVGQDGPPPSVCIEVLSASNTATSIDRRCRRWLDAGVNEVYLLDPERQTFDRALAEGAGVSWREARGTYSAGMNATLALLNGRLAVCFPGGRAIGVDDDALEWLADEQQRADAAETRADAAETRADAAETRAEAAERRIAELEAALARLRPEPESNG